MHDSFTEDRFLNGVMILRQPAHGYRAGADAILLAAAVEAPAGASLLEAGCGAGAALIAAALLNPETRFSGVERDPAAAALARDNVALNNLLGRVDVTEGDVLTAGGPAGESFDGVFMNPPFDEEGAAQNTKSAPHPARRGAYLTEGSIDDWIKASSNRLTGGAALTLIQRAHHLPAILAALEGRLGGIEVFPIRPRADEPAKRVLVRARKGARAPLRLLKGLDLHGGEGKFTDEADSIFRGKARIAWR
jgi:tRNA1(Val) A37 N6-methylase TrmN6